MPTKNKEVFNRNRNAWVAKRREFFNELKSVPCFDCGGVFPPYVMDFDHKPEYEKSFTISRRWQYSKEKILAEIAKCDVVCANCHRIRTHGSRLLIPTEEEHALEA